MNLEWNNDKFFVDYYDSYKYKLLYNKMNKTNIF